MSCEEISQFKNADGSFTGNKKKMQLKCRELQKEYMSKTNSTLQEARQVLHCSFEGLAERLCSFYTQSNDESNQTHKSSVNLKCNGDKCFLANRVSPKIKAVSSKPKTVSPKPKLVSPKSKVTSSKLKATDSNPVQSKAVKSCTEQRTKKYTERPSPPYPANECKKRTMQGNDGKDYISTITKPGYYKWKLVTSAKEDIKPKKSLEDGPFYINQIQVPESLVIHLDTLKRSSTKQIYKEVDDDNVIKFLELCSLLAQYFDNKFQEEISKAKTRFGENFDQKQFVEEHRIRIAEEAFMFAMNASYYVEFTDLRSLISETSFESDALTTKEWVEIAELASEFKFDLLEPLLMLLPLDAVQGLNDHLTILCSFVHPEREKVLQRIVRYKHVLFEQETKTNEFMSRWKMFYECTMHNAWKWFHDEHVYKPPSVLYESIRTKWFKENLEKIIGNEDEFVQKHKNFVKKLQIQNTYEQLSMLGKVYNYAKEKSRTHDLYLEIDGSHVYVKKALEYPSASEDNPYLNTNTEDIQNMLTEAYEKRTFRMQDWGISHVRQDLSVREAEQIITDLVLAGDENIKVAYFELQIDSRTTQLSRWLHFKKQIESHVRDAIGKATRTLLNAYYDTPEFEEEERERDQRIRRYAQI